MDIFLIGLIKSSKREKTDRKAYLKGKMLSSALAIFDLKWLWDVQEDWPADCQSVACGHEDLEANLYNRGAD